MSVLSLKTFQIRKILCIISDTLVVTPIRNPITAISIIVKFFSTNIVFSSPWIESQKVSIWMMAGRAMPMVARQRAPMSEMKSSKLGIAAARTTGNEKGEIWLIHLFNL